jgi:hypothetical protein
MNRRIRSLLFWASLVGGAGILHWLFFVGLRMPVASIITLSVVLTWLIPRPLPWLLGMAVFAELIAITPPLTLTLGILSPLLIFWLRGRISVDISLSYIILIATSVALAFTIVIGVSAFPAVFLVPWPRILLAWIVVTCCAASITLLFPSLTSRYLHDRYH